MYEENCPFTDTATLEENILALRKSGKVIVLLDEKQSLRSSSIDREYYCARLRSLRDIAKHNKIPIVMNAVLSKEKMRQNSL